MATANNSPASTLNPKRRTTVDTTLRRDVGTSRV